MNSVLCKSFFEVDWILLQFLVPNNLHLYTFCNFRRSSLVQSLTSLCYGTISLNSDDTADVEHSSCGRLCTTLELWIDEHTQCSNVHCWTLDFYPGKPDLKFNDAPSKLQDPISSFHTVMPTAQLLVTWQYIDAANTIFSYWLRGYHPTTETWDCDVQSNKLVNFEFMLQVSVLIIAISTSALRTTTNTKKPRLLSLHLDKSLTE